MVRNNTVNKIIVFFLCLQGRDLQRSIEEEFLKKTNCFKFKISEQDYALYFYPSTEMHQENLRYGTTKKVRRRPAEFKSGADIRELKRYVQRILLTNSGLCPRRYEIFYAIQLGYLHSHIPQLPFAQFFTIY